VVVKSLVSLVCVEIDWLGQSAVANASLVVAMVIAVGATNEVTLSVGGLLHMTRSSGVELDVVRKNTARSAAGACWQVIANVNDAWKLLRGVLPSSW